MKVWVVTHSSDYEGDTVLGAALDPDTGKRVAEQNMAGKPPKRWTFVVDSDGQEYWVTGAFEVTSDMVVRLCDEVERLRGLTEQAARLWPFEDDGGLAQ
jgi:hypothetical protein